MISELRFKNFKCLVDVQLALTPFTVLVGANGCGKSSVLQAAHLLSRVCRPQEGERRMLALRFGEIFKDALDPLRIRTARSQQSILLGETIQGGDTLSLEVRPPRLENSKKSDWSKFVVSVEGQAGADWQAAAIPGSWEGPQHSNELQATLAILEDPRFAAFASAAYLRLDAAMMTRTWISQEEVPRMGENGEGLASTLAYLAGATPETLRQIAADLARVVPGVRGIRTYREKVQSQEMEQLNVDGQPLWRPVTYSRVGDRFAVEFEHAGIVPADLLSEGTVLALGLITKLYEPDHPRLILLDDIDRALHPEAQARLVKTLRVLREARGDLQLVCTSHSPYLLSSFQPEEVRVLALDDKRRTHACPLTAHPDFAKLKHGFQTGEIWMTLGEDWVAREGRHG